MNLRPLVSSGVLLILFTTLITSKIYSQEEERERKKEIERESRQSEEERAYERDEMRRQSDDETNAVLGILKLFREARPEPPKPLSKEEIFLLKKRSEFYEENVFRFLSSLATKGDSISICALAIKDYLSTKDLSYKLQQLARNGNNIVLHHLPLNGVNVAAGLRNFDPYFIEYKLRAKASSDMHTYFSEPVDWDATQVRYPYSNDESYVKRLSYMRGNYNLLSRNLVDRYRKSSDINHIDAVSALLSSNIDLMRSIGYTKAYSVLLDTSMLEINKLLKYSFYTKKTLDKDIKKHPEDIFLNFKMVTTKKLIGDLYIMNLGSKATQADSLKAYAEAVKWYQEALDEGNLEVKYIFSNWYMKGIFFQQNFPTGLKLLKEYSSKGDPISLINLAELYEYGLGVDKDLNRAVEYYKDAVFKGEFASGISGIKRINPKLLKNVPPFVTSVDEKELNEILNKDTSAIKVFHYLNRYESTDSLSYKQSIPLLKYLKQNTKKDIQFYLGGVMEPSSVLLPEFFGYQGLVFNILYNRKYKFEKIYKTYYKNHPEEITQEISREFIAYNSLVIPEFDERWTNGLPVTLYM